MTNNKNGILWKDCLKIIKDNVTWQQYKTWFEPIVFESFTEKIIEGKKQKTLLIRVPSPFVREYLEENYVMLLYKVICRVFGTGVTLSYRVLVDKEHNLTQVFEGEQPLPINSSKEQRRANKSPGILDAVTCDLDTQLDPHKTFQSFIEGDSNKLSRTIGLSVAEHPGKSTFNPFFIFGPSGCGKTHLINAIGVRAKQLYPQKRVLYVSARLFQVQFTDAVRQNSVNDFINFYQTIDVLIVDDIQEWITAKATLNTFFHIFNHLFRNGRQIVLASDRPPVDLKAMKERLLTRFSCGLIAEIEKPNVQLCIDILNSKSRRDGLHLSKDVIQFIAENANGNVRDLEGVVNSLLAYSVVYNCPVDIHLARRVISRTARAQDTPVTFDDILHKVCQHYKVEQSDVKGKSRKRDVVKVRQVSMYLAQKYTSMTMSHIGRLIGGRDHSTVIHSCTAVKERLNSDNEFLREIKSIEDAFELKADS